MDAKNKCDRCEADPSTWAAELWIYATDVLLCSSCSFDVTCAAETDSEWRNAEYLADCEAE